MYEARHNQFENTLDEIGDRDVSYTTDPADKSGATRVASLESRKGNDV
ncbi:MAG: hypothetical protein KC777_10840 [Cyanobacteria bacterium HKST-UBA02]|nr:hypothetical protein [Cyanobacteria bacterium HKST-UBA02]